MKSNSRFSLLGFFLFLIPLTLSLSLGIVIYDRLQAKYDALWIIAIFMLIYIIFITLLFTFFDIIRRKRLEDRPVEQILKATEQIARGNFDIKLTPLHTFYKYDKYDEIMENINKMVEELSKSEMLKQDFISNVSHEIKSPLALIQNYANSLKNENLSKEQREKYLQNLIMSTQKLSSLVTNILKLSKLENQGISPSKKRVNVGELARECVLQFERQIECKNLVLNCQIDDIEVVTDGGYLEIVFSNLISNAIKFNKEGGILNITLAKEGEVVIFSVQDSGCGISKAGGQRIFEKFYQCETSHATEGNGLGLALVKKIVDILGSEISVESEVDKGSTFTFKLKGSENGEI